MWTSEVLQVLKNLET